MAEDTVDHAIMIGALPERTCITQNLPIHGYSQNVNAGESPMTVYGVEMEKVESLGYENANYSGYLSKELGIRKSQVIWAVRNEMARTIEDILARRTRALFLDARESIRIAEETATLMAIELDKDKKWIDKQVKQFTETALGYLVEGIK
jgi:glycerol-3-phosphate dehydrogenase